MARDREHQVVMRGAHGFDVRSECLPERPQLLDRIIVRAFGGREDAPAVDEQTRESGVRARILGPRDRMRRYKMRMTGQHRRQRRDDSALDRTHVRYDRAFSKRRRDRTPDLLIGADWRAENDAIGAAHGASQIVGDDVAKPQRFRALQNRNGRVGKNDAPGGMAMARGAGDRRADQPYPDNR